jgi:hypothetical protein
MLANRMSRYSRTLCLLGLALVLAGLAEFVYFLHVEMPPRGGMMEISPEQSAVFASAVGPLVYASSILLLASGVALVTAGLAGHFVRPKSS